MSVKHNVSVIANMLYIKIKKVSFSLLTVHSETRTTACLLSILTTHTHLAVLHTQKKLRYCYNGKYIITTGLSYCPDFKY
jgi:hypothetical protein